MESIQKYKELPNHIFTLGNLKILKTTALYGKNASGKSNFLLAMSALSYMVNRSNSFKINQPIKCYEPFAFENKSAYSPVNFEILFLGKNKIKYRYKVSFNKEEILEESLFYYPTRQKEKLYTRKKTLFSFSELLIGKVEGIKKNILSNQLFLSKVSTENINELIEPYLFFDKYFFISIPNQSCNICDKRIIDIHTNQLFNEKDPKFWENINKLLKFADTGINSISIQENKEDDFIFPETISEERKRKIIDENRLQVTTKHNLYEGDKLVGEVEIELDEESSGTNRLLAIGGLILDAVSDGTTFVVDELERSLHPYLTKTLVQIFNNPRTNPNNAQLIFATHDVSLLNNDLFRRDQVWFAEKDEKGGSSFYSLGDIKGVRKEVPFHKYYMNGLFGGVPNINFYDFDFNYNIDE